MPSALRLLLLLTSCLLPGLGLANPGDTLVFDWQLAAIEAPDGNELVPVAIGDKLSFRADGSFQLTSDSLQEVGRWRKQGDSVYLVYELLPVARAVDSLFYRVEDGVPTLYLYQDGELVARQLDRGLSSERRQEAYALTFNEADFPILKGEDRVIRLRGRAQPKPESVGWWDVLRGLLGIAAMLGLAWLFSVKRKAVNWRLVGIGMGLQLFLAILVLKVPGVKEAFGLIADGFVALLAYASAGAEFVFGGLAGDIGTFGYIIAFQVLPTIVFFSALTATLYYLGVLQKVVYGFAWLMQRTMGLSGAESLAAAGNIFLGQTEAPLLVRPYLERMTRSEIMALMTGGMATIAGGVFAAYVGYLGGPDPEMQRKFAKHLLTASIMSAPAALVVAKILVPETQQVNQNLDVPKDKIGVNLLDAISIGITDGLKLAVNVGVMLLVFTALMEMLNAAVSGLIGGPTGLDQIVMDATDGRFTFNLQFLLGLVFAPIAWLLGVPMEDMVLIGQLLGEKTIINEFVAYGYMGEAKEAGRLLNEKSIIIATYALCGFANLASIGIQIGGIGALAPNQRKNLSELGILALIGGTLAAFLTAVMAGVIAFI
jgi:concentrative nucleoside transporter, CNT family